MEWQRDLYESLIEYTGLKGNRAAPMPKAGFAELRDTKMPAVLLELGFMDSATDVPVILSEEYADQCAEAIVKVLVDRGGLEKKASEPEKIYRVQVGAFSDPRNAQAMLDKLEAAGFDGFIT